MKPPEYAPAAPPPAPFPAGCGIYCLGHDGVLDWMIGLLESLKANAPHCPIFVIPFDDNIAKLTVLQSRYGFQWHKSDVLPALEDMARTHLGKCEHAARVFRKLSVFWGPLEHFLFLDADMVALDDLAGLFLSYKASGLGFAFADADMEQAYHPGPLREKMMAEHGAQGFNSGCFLSSRDALTWGGVQAGAREAASVKAGFVSRYEQSFLNFLVDTSGIAAGRFSDFCAAYGPSVWAALSPLCSGQFLRAAGQSAPGMGQLAPWLVDNGTPKHPMPLLHWAGFACDGEMPNAHYFLRYRLRGGTAGERAAFWLRFTKRRRAAIAMAFYPRPALGRLRRKLLAAVPEREVSASETVQP